MSNITKNLLLILTLVCVIALVVFCIQLIVINRGVDPVTPGTTVSGGTQGDEGADSDEDGEGTANEDGLPGGDGFTDPALRPPPIGRQGQIQVTSDSALSLYVIDELFDFQQGDLDWSFYYTGGGNAALDISFRLITTEGVAAHAEDFLNTYSGGNNAEFGGEELIRGSSLMGYHVSARHGTETFEAWIHMLEGSDLALVFVITYENDQQRNALYNMLSTLDIGPPDPNLILVPTPPPDPDPDPDEYYDEEYAYEDPDDDPDDEE